MTAVRFQGLRLKTWKPGEPVDSRALNQVNRAVEDLRKQFAAPRQVAGTGTAAAGLAMFKVSSIDGDFVKCFEFDGSVTGTVAIPIAKPYLLRRSPFDGLTRNGITYTYSSDIQRTADDGATTETQVVVPSWVVGDVIFASRALRGTGVSTVSVGVSTAVSWIDVNADGRAWAKEA